MDPARVLVIDNYDSFTHNACDLLRQLGVEPLVRRNDEITLREVHRERPKAILLSPGPGRPEDAGICVELIERLRPGTHLLGICLGHQAIAAAFGGRIVRAVEPLHGSASTIESLGRGLLKALPRRFEAARYHSLVVDPGALGRHLVPTARSARGEIMGLMHKRRPIEGVQFHPESYLSPTGPRLLAAFLERAGLPVRPWREVLR